MMRRRIQKLQRQIMPIQRIARRRGLTSVVCASLSMRSWSPMISFFSLASAWSPFVCVV